MGRFSINKEMLLAKIAIFFVNAKDGTYRPFLTVYLISIGLNPAQAGLIGAAALCGGAIGGIVFSVLADRTRLYALIILFVNTASIATMTSQPWLAEMMQPKPHLVQNSAKNVTYTSSAMHSNHTHNLRNQLMQNNTGSFTFKDDALREEEYALDRLFLVSIAAFATMRFFDGPNTGFCFSTVAASVKEQTDNSNLGRQLMFGGIGTAASAMLTGVLVDYVRFPGLSKYSTIFFTYPIAIIAYLAATFSLRLRLNKNTDLQSNNSSVIDSFKEVVKNIKLIFFLATVLVTGIGLNLIYGYLSLHLSEMNASGTIMGLCILSSAGSSVVAMAFAAKIIKFLGGPMNTLVLACFSYSIRLAGFSLMTEPWQAPIIQTLHFFGYGLFLPSVIQHIDNVSPVNIKTSMQTIAVAVHFQLGGLIADLNGGIIYRQYGGKILYACGAGLLAVWSVLAFIYIFFSHSKFIQVSCGDKYGTFNQAHDKTQKKVHVQLNP